MIETIIGAREPRAPFDRAFAVKLLLVTLTALAVTACAGLEPARLNSKLASSTPAPSATSAPVAVPATGPAGTTTPSGTRAAVSGGSTPGTAPGTPTVAGATTAPAASDTPAGSGTPVAVDSAVEQAIKAVIQKANDEQVEAFTKGDPTVMRDTATSSYYDELVKTNQDLANNGVSAIKLVRLEWGPVTLQDPSTARVTTFETWLTSFSDGQTEQDRDRNVYTLVRENDTWKIQADDHPDTNLDNPGGPGTSGPGPAQTPNPGGTPGPAPSAVIGRAPRNPDQSRNWSGYAATGGKFTAVTGTWNVPQATDNGDGTFATDATWVGIGGANSRDLIQAGTETTTNGSNHVLYEAWIEMLPQRSTPVKLTVNPGDSVTVSISQDASGQWTIAFINNTTGQKYQTAVQYTSTLSSAEWIEEAPSGGRRVLPLDNFGTIQFTNATAVEDGKKVTVAEAGGKPITMVDRNDQAIATPSALGADGSSFTIARTNVNTSPAVGTPQPGRTPPARRRTPTAVPATTF